MQDRVYNTSFSHPAFFLKIGFKTMINITVKNMTLGVKSSYEPITARCFDWCREQSFIYQQNLEIRELSFIVIALISIVVHWVIDEHFVYFISHDFDKKVLEKIHDGTLLLNFMMLILFLIYMMWLR